jgi:hypothetical protein
MKYSFWIFSAVEISSHPGGPAGELGESVPDTFSGKLHLGVWKTDFNGECCVFFLWTRSCNR